LQLYAALAASYAYSSTGRNEKVEPADNIVIWFSQDLAVVGGKGQKPFFKLAIG
jgi:hypothetical protein